MIFIRFIRKAKWIILGILTILFMLPGFKDASYLRLYLLLLLILFFIYVVVDWYLQKNKIRKLTNENLRAELGMLHSQINPHFFFNTLNNLYGLAVENSKSTPEVILKLSDVMRYTIYEGGKEKVTIENEIVCLENYIDLQLIRYKDKPAINFEKATTNVDIKVAPLFFLVLLENAFKHGVENMTQGAYVNITLVGNEDKVTFQIENNFDPVVADRKSGGIGLENLTRRLELLYPGKHYLKISTNDPNVFRARLDLELNK